MRKVTESLRLGLSDSEQVRYFAAFLVLIILGLNLPVDSEARGWLGQDGFWKWLTYSTIALAGSFVAFRANRSGDAKEFVTRYIALFVPLTVQSLCVVLLGLVFAALVPHYLSEDHVTALNKSSFWDWFWFGLQALAECLLFFRLITNVRRVSTAHDLP